MRTYLVTISRVFCVFSLAALTGCLSSGATPPGANAPCATNDDCPSGYQCFSPTNASPGKLFCCKDKNSCGPAGSGGASGGVIDGGGAASGGAIAMDGPSSRGGAVDVASAGGAGGSITLDGGLAGAGGGIVLAGGSTSSGGITGGLASGGTAGSLPASGGILTGGTGSGGIVAAGGAGGGLDAARDVPAPVGDAPALLPLGKTCTADTDCALGNCVDGLCCNKSKTACGGCNACTNALTGLDDGTCGAVSAGKIAHSACTDETATKPCGNDGTCDGNGACRKVSSSHVCTPASCSTDGKTFTPSTTCDSKGACTTATAQPCGAFQCATTGCMQTCTVQTDCVGTNYCNTAVTPAVCAAKKVNGSTASQTYECTSGVVADGVCCDKACSGCSACTLALNGQTGASVANGQCLAVVAGQVGHSTCTASPPCGLDGKCDGNGACRYTTAGTSCAADSCSVSTLTTKACDTSHACTPSTGACPGQLICGSAAACKPNCAADSDCTAGNYCASGACTIKKDNGGSCAADGQCKNGNCVAGICCNTACGTCNSCATGTCTPVLGGTACTGGVCSAGSCQDGCWIGGGLVLNGTTSGACQICTPSKSTSAWSNKDGSCTGTPICSGTDQIASQFACTGGACQASAYAACSGGFACANNACKTSCQSASDCQSGAYCYSQTCHAKVKYVALGGTHTCAALADGRVVCWGGDYAGGHMLGDGVVHTSPVANPVQVANMFTATAVRAAGSSTCALTSAGTVYCWGDGDNGALGTGTNTPAPGQTSYWKNTPVQVVTSSGNALSGVTSLYSGGLSYCAQTSSQIYCWGDNGQASAGYLGYVTPTYPTAILSAAPLPGATTASSFAMGFLYELAVTGSTTLHAWGDNRGTGLVVSDLTSTQVYPSYSGQTNSLTSAITQVSAGGEVACVLLSMGSVQCWGYNFYGSLGIGGSTNWPIPGQTVGSGFTHLAVGGGFVCAQTADTHNVTCWGDNDYGVVNSNTSNNKITLPTTVALGLPIALTVTEVVTGPSAAHVCVLISDGSLMCWGRGDWMQTGTGQTTTATTPAFVIPNW
jgi:alpha-tubulin suppressor-like RCC1 family protein